MSAFQRDCTPNVSDKATEEVRACPYCGNETTDLWTYGRDRLHHITDATFPYVKCRDCDVIFLARRPCQNEIGAFYPVEYAPYGQSLPQKFRSQRRRAFERVLNGVARSLLHFETQAKSEVGKYYDGKVKPDQKEVKEYAYQPMKKIEDLLQSQPDIFTAWFHIAFPKVMDWWNRRTMV